MLAPSRAARNAMASPIPREAPVMNSVLPLSDMARPFRSSIGSDPAQALSHQRGFGAVDAVRALDHGAFEACGLDRKVFGIEAGDGDPAGRILSLLRCGKPHGGERFLGEQAAAGRM